MSMVPVGKDQLGARLVEQKAQGTVEDIPDDESIILVNWLRFDDVTFPAANRYVGLHFYRTSGGNNFIDLRVASTGRVAAELFRNGTVQSLVARVPFQQDRDHMVAIVVDRDSTIAHVWMDNAWLATDIAITQDPDLTVNNLMRLHVDSADTPVITSWRGCALSIKAGEMLAADKLAPIFHGIQDPGTPWPDEIMDVVESFDGDYRPGEGVQDSTTLTDEGANEDDLTWQGGVTVEDVRVGLRVQTPIPRYTWSTLKSGYTAGLAGQDYDFDQGPVLMRIVYGDTHSHEGGAYNIAHLTSSGGDYIYWRKTGAAGGPIFIYTYTNGTQRLIMEIAGEHQEWLLDGGDLWIVVRNATTCDVFINAQRLASRTDLTAVMNLSGNCNIDLDGRNDLCRMALWNPPTVPSTFEEEIRYCVMNPELDPASLEDYRKVNYGFSSDKFPLGTETTLPNDWGDGTLTLSAQFSDSCEVMITGYDP